MRPIVFLALAVLVSTATPAAAQRDTAIPIQFDFISPGAASLGLGGAFTVANDATAASTNPAGLVGGVSKKEVSVEARGWRYVTEFVRAGRVSGTLTRRGIDQQDGPDLGRFTRSSVGLSFLSYVHHRRDLRVAGYRQEVSRLRAGAKTEGFFFVRAGDPTDRRELPFDVDRHIDVVNYGGSAAYRFGSVDVGAGLFLSSLDLRTRLRGYEYPEPNGVRDLYAPADYSQQLYEGTQTADGWAPGFNAGAIWQASERLHVGASLKRNARFDFEGRFSYPDHLGDEGRERENSTYTGTFKVPDMISLGVTIYPNDARTIKINADYSHVRYSQLEGFIRDSIVFFSALPEEYEIPDSNELHLGVEIARQIATDWVLAIRAGSWTDPDHALRYNGSNDQWRVLPPGETLLHGSIGIGISQPLSNRYELNAALDFSKGPIVASTSAIFRF